MSLAQSLQIPQDSQLLQVLPVARRRAGRGRRRCAGRRSRRWPSRACPARKSARDGRARQIRGGGDAGAGQDRGRHVLGPDADRPRRAGAVEDRHAAEGSGRARVAVGREHDEHALPARGARDLALEQSRDPRDRGLPASPARRRADVAARAGIPSRCRTPPRAARSASSATRSASTPSAARGEHRRVVDDGRRPARAPTPTTRPRGSAARPKPRPPRTRGGAGPHRRPARSPTSRSAGPTPRRYQDVPKGGRSASGEPARPHARRAPARRGGAGGSRGEIASRSPGRGALRPATSPWRPAPAGPGEPPASPRPSSSQTVHRDDDDRSRARSDGWGAGTAARLAPRREEQAPRRAGRPPRPPQKTPRPALAGQRARARERAREKAEPDGRGQRRARRSRRERPRAAPRRELAREAVGAGDPEDEDAPAPQRAPRASPRSPGARARSASHPGQDARSAAGSRFAEKRWTRSAATAGERARNPGSAASTAATDASAAANAPSSTAGRKTPPRPWKTGRKRSCSTPGVRYPSSRRRRRASSSVGRARHERRSRTTRARSASTAPRRPSGRSAADAPPRAAPRRGGGRTPRRGPSRSSRGGASRPVSLPIASGSPSRSSRSSVIWKASPRLRAKSVRAASIALARPARERAAPHGRDEERSRLPGVDRLEVVEVDRRRVGREVRRLPGAAALGADRRARAPGAIRARAAGGHLRGARGDLEGAGEQGHGRELRGGHAVDDVERRPSRAGAARRPSRAGRPARARRRGRTRPRRPRPVAALGGRAGELAGGERGERPQPLARRQRRLGDRASESELARPPAGRRKAAPERLFERRAGRRREPVEGAAPRGGALQGPGS